MAYVREFGFSDSGRKTLWTDPAIPNDASWFATTMNRDPSSYLQRRLQLQSRKDFPTPHR